MSIRIVTDSTCDLPADVVREHQITVVPCFVNFGDQSLLDGIEISRQEFYERLPDADPPPTTSAPGLGTFAQTYRRLALEGATGIVSVHIAGSLSNVVNVARVAAQAALGVPIRVVDGGQITLGTGLLAVAAAEAAASGASLDDVTTLVQEHSQRMFSFAALNTLTFLQRSGRVSRFASGLGAMLQVKPILKMHSGVIEVERVRTRQRAEQRLLELAGHVGSLERIAFVHTHALERAEDLRRHAARMSPIGKPIWFGEVTPVIGAHVGPGAVGIICQSDHQSNSSASERGVP